MNMIGRSLRPATRRCRFPTLRPPMGAIPSGISFTGCSPSVRLYSSPTGTTGEDPSHSPLSKIRSKHQFEEPRLVQYLQTQQVLSQGDSNIVINQFSHGQSNPTFVLECDVTREGVQSRRRIVIRKQPPGKLLKGAHAVDREHRTMTALWNHTGASDSRVPVPRTLLYCGDSEIIGTPFFCYEFVEGRFYKAPQLQSVSPERKTAMYRSMLDTLARLHSVDVDQAGLGDYGVRVGAAKSPPVAGTAEGAAAPPLPYVLRQVKTWTKQFRAAETEAIPDMEQLIENLPRLLPEGAEAKSCLVHGDYRLDNVIFHEDTDTMAAVLDWELSTLGDPLSDLAYHSMVYHLDPANPFLRGVRGLDLKAEGIPSQAEAIRYYGERLEVHSKGRMSAPKERDIDYYLAFSFFRACAILQGVYKRSLLGNASAENAGLTLAFAKETAKLGNDLLQSYKRSLGGSLGGHGGALAGGHGAGAGGFLASRPKQQSIVPSSHLFDNSISPKAHLLIDKATEFITHRVLPAEATVLNHTYDSPDKWTKIHPLMEEMKGEAKALGLWNLFMPTDTDKGQYGAGLTNLEYALIAEMTGRTLIAPEVFNCSAPDTGNMEVLARYGTEEQKDMWLAPLLQGDIRSCFAMTEPAVASSDATNMAATVRSEGGDVILSGRKWWISGAMDPRCKVAIFMGRIAGDLTDSPKHQRHSMVLVPMDTPGISIVRPLRVMGFDDAPHGHAELTFDEVTVPKGNIILGEGRAFEVAQGRLGPGRIHHCMRLIGMAERALELMVQRVTHREAFGKYLAEQGTIQMDIAMSRVEIDQARLLCLNAAAAMDRGGNKAAKAEIASIKIVAPKMAKTVIDRAMQSLGGLGLSQDTPLAHMWANARVLQLADGPDEVHIASLAKQLIHAQEPSYRSRR